MGVQYSFLSLFQSSCGCSLIACHEKAVNDRDSRRILEERPTLRTDKLWKMAASDISFLVHWFKIRNQVCNGGGMKSRTQQRCWTRGKKLLQVYPADELWYKTLTSKEVPDEKNFADQVHLPPGVSLEQQAEKWAAYPICFFIPYLSFSGEQFCFFFFFFWVGS